MPIIPNATIQEVARIIRQICPDLAFVIHEREEGIVYHEDVTGLNGPVPTIEEIEAALPGIRVTLAREAAERNKLDAFQRLFSVQEQLVKIMQDIIARASTNSLSMLNVWNNL